MTNFDTAMHYAQGMIDGSIPANKKRVQAAKRFIADLKRTDEFDFRTDQADFVIDLIESTIVHQQGETLTGAPLRGEPMRLTDWQKFVVMNICGFFEKGKQIRRYKEALIMVTRKQGKTAFAAAFGWALSILEARSGSKLSSVFRLCPINEPLSARLVNNVISFIHVHTC